MQNNSKRANSLDGKTWTRYSISVWNDIHKNLEEKRYKHPALFPAALVKRLLEIFAKRGCKILDPFLGSGSTLIEAQRQGMEGLGFEISPHYITLFERRLKEEKVVIPSVKAYHDDARNLQNYLAPATIDLCLTSPPYWNILKERRSADLKPARSYGDEQSDLGNIDSYDFFLDELEQIFSAVFSALKKGGYCIVVVMDIRKKSRFYPLHMDLCRRLEAVGFLLDDIIIWDRRADYNNLRPLGFPYVFRVNKIHEYIMIFQKT